MARPKADSPAPALSQRDVQDAVLALMRVAVVWARRSFEQDAPPDRLEDQLFLAKAAALIHEHAGTARTLVRATGSTRAAFREDSFTLLELYEEVYALAEAFGRSSRTANRKEWFKTSVGKALIGKKLPASARRVQREFENFAGPASALASRVLMLAGLKGYRTRAALKHELERAKQIRARREVSTLELVEYFLACLPVPKENLHELARAVWTVRLGGRLSAVPSGRPGRRSNVSGRVPTVPAPYPRYGAARIADDTEGVLDLEQEFEAGDDDDADSDDGGTT